MISKTCQRLEAPSPSKTLKTFFFPHSFLRSCFFFPTLLLSASISCVVFDYVPFFSSSPLPVFFRCSFWIVVKNLFTSSRPYALVGFDWQAGTASLRPCKGPSAPPPPPIMSVISAVHCLLNNNKWGLSKTHRSDSFSHIIPFTLHIFHAGLQIPQCSGALLFCFSKSICSVALSIVQVESRPKFCICSDKVGEETPWVDPEL